MYRLMARSISHLSGMVLMILASTLALVPTSRADEPSKAPTVSVDQPAEKEKLGRRAEVVLKIKGHVEIGDGAWRPEMGTCLITISKDKNQKYVVNSSCVRLKPTNDASRLEFVFECPTDWKESKAHRMSRGYYVKATVYRVRGGDGGKPTVSEASSKAREFELGD